MATTIEELQVRIGARISGLEKGLKDAEGKIQSFGKRLDKVGRSATRNVTLPLAAAGVAAVKFAGDFESSFANVRKTTDATESQFQALQKEFRGMAKEIPTGVNELNNLAGVAGQLGVEAENLAQFTRTIAMLGDTTDISGEQAALSLSRFMNVMGTAQGDVDRLGSTIVGLGNNFAAMESEIIEIGTSFASFARGVGFTESDVLAFATTIAASGGQAEAASSAFQRTSSEIQKAVIGGGAELEKFARISGQTSDEFSKGFKDDAAGAIVTFLKGLERVRNSGESVGATLESVGLGDTRIERELNKVIGNLGDLDASLAQSNEEWDKNNALTEEAEKRYDTFNSRIKVLWNNLYDLGITIGDLLIPYVESLAESIQGAVDWFQDLDEGSQKLILGLGALATAIGPVMVGIGFMAKNIGVATKALGVLRVAAMANPWVLLAGAIAAAGTALYLYSRNTNDVIDQQKELTNVNVQAQKSIAGEQAELKKLLAIARTETLSKNRRQKAIEKLNEIVPQYNDNLSLETINTDEARKATDKYVTSLLSAAKARAAEQKLQEIQSRRIDLENFTGEFEGLGDRVEQTEALRSRIESLNKQIDKVRDAEFFPGKGDQFTRLLGDRAALQERLKEIEGDVGETIDNVNKDFDTIEKSLLDTITSTGGAISDYVAPEARALSEEFFKIKDSLSSLSGEELTDAERRMAEISADAKRWDLELQRVEDTVGRINEASGNVTTPRMTAPEAIEPGGVDTIPDLSIDPEDELQTDITQIDTMAESVEGLNESMIRAQETARGVGMAFGQAFQQAASESDDAMQAMTDGIRAGVRAAIKAFLAQAIAAQIAASAGTGPIGLALAAGVPAIVGGIFDAAVPAFAKGGLVAGPTLGLIGEGPGTSASNPEVIAPLDKLKSMIGGVGQTIDVRMRDVRLEGQDLLLAFDRATDFRNRTT